jgi:hypothetical protein
MRTPVAAVVLLILFGLVPVGLWLAMTVSLEPVGLGRNIGMAILVVLSPAFFGGLLMIAGAAMLQRTRRFGRIVATVGAGIVALEAAVIALFWLARVSRCTEDGSFCVERMAEGGAAFLFALAHVAVIILVWRRDTARAEAPPRCRPSRFVAKQ